MRNMRRGGGSEETVIVARKPCLATRARKRREGSADAWPSVGRRAAFAREYVLDHNATQAAIRAGYAPDSAKVTGCRLLTDANVAARIAELEARTIARAEKGADAVVRELEALAYSDIGDLFETGGPDDAVPRIRPMHDWPERARRAIQSVKVKYVDPLTDHKTGAVIREGFHILEFRMHAKQPALEALGKRTGAIPKDAPTSGERGVHFHFHGARMGFETEDPELVGKMAIVVGQENRRP